MAVGFLGLVRELGNGEVSISLHRPELSRLHTAMQQKNETLTSEVCYPSFLYSIVRLRTKAFFLQPLLRLSLSFDVRVG